MGFSTDGIAHDRFQIVVAGLMARYERVYFYTSQPFDLNWISFSSIRASSRLCVIL